MVLKNKLRLYVPSKDKAGKRIDNRMVLRRVMKVFNTLFGGCTVYEAKGSYVVKTGKLIIEEIRIVEAFCSDETLADALKALRELAKDMKRELNQELVSIECNDTLELI